MDACFIFLSMDMVLQLLSGFNISNVDDARSAASAIRIDPIKTGLEHVVDRWSISFSFVWSRLGLIIY